MIRNKCPNCGSPKYLLTGLNLVSDTEYEQLLKCRKCETEWGGRQQLVSGANTYAYVWDTVNKKSVALHRWVWEQSNGRSLSPIEVVHHKNRIKGDDRPSNLALMDRYSHNGSFKNSPICKRCGHRWYPHQPEVTICPKCKSPYWNKEKKE